MSAWAASELGNAAFGDKRLTARLCRLVDDLLAQPTASLLMPCSPSCANLRKTASKLSAWLEVNIPEGLTVFSFPASRQQRVRTTNGLERLNQEIRRGTRVVGMFPNQASCLRLVTALAMETSDEWETGKVYVSLTPV